LQGTGDTSAVDLDASTRAPQWHRRYTKRGLSCSPLAANPGGACYDHAVVVSPHLHREFTYYAAGKSSAVHPLDNPMRRSGMVHLMRCTNAWHLPEQGQAPQVKTEAILVSATLSGQPSPPVV
jgi:hypothetical protein